MSALFRWNLMRVNVYACHVLMMSLSCEVDVKCCNAKDSEYVYFFDSQIRAFTTRSRHALPPDARLPSAEILALQTSKCTTAVSYMLQPAGQQHDNDTARCECCCCIECDTTHASESSHSLCLSVVQHLLSMIEGAHHYTSPFECSLAVLEPTTCNRNVHTYTSRSTISRHARTRHPHCIARLPASGGYHCRLIWPAKLAFLEQFRGECSWQSEWSGA